MTDGCYSHAVIRKYNYGSKELTNGKYMVRMILEKMRNICFNSTFQRAERRAYYANCLKAEQQPRRYMSLILDGMDQSKTNLPHANCLSKVS